MHASFLRLFGIVLATAGAASAQSIQEWTRFDVFAVLDNDGAVIVTETLVAHLNGGPVMLDRQLVAGTDQEIVIRKIVRVEENEEMELADVRWFNGELFWRIKADSDPDWKDATLTFRLEYELRGAIQPAWDIPAGPGSFRSRETFPHFRERWRELFAAWREPARRYRFDHDVLFAKFSSEGPRELNYTFKYDTQWKHPQPDAELAVRVTPGSDYRVTELRDYLRTGLPPAVAIWKPAVRVGSIAAYAVVALGLWLIFAFGEVRRRGWIGARLSRAWFQENIASIPAEILARAAGTTSHVSGFPLLLARWRSRGVVEVHEGAAASEDDDPILHLRLRGDESRLPAYERAVLAQLFPKGRDITSVDLQQVYAQDGFDPEYALDDALNERGENESQRATPQPSWFWKIIQRLVPWILVAGFGLMLAEAFRSQYADSINATFYLGGGVIAAMILAWNLPVTLGGLFVALAMLVPVVAAVPGLIALHFHHTLPLLPEGSAGLALLALGCVAATLLAARMSAEKFTPERRLAVLGDTFVRRQLRRARPDLDDAWLPQIVALGCASAVEKWRTSRSHDSVVMPGAVPLLEPARPFTGNFPRPEEQWVSALEVLSAEDRKDFEEEENKDGEDENSPPR